MFSAPWKRSKFKHIQCMNQPHIVTEKALSIILSPQTGFKDRKVVLQMFFMSRTLRNNQRIQIKVSLCKRNRYYNN